jgi:hypothetical protein
VNDTRRKRRRREIDPVAHFATWDFDIPRYFWGSFDVRRTTRIRDSRPMRVWTIGLDPFIDFQEGDVFYARSGQLTIQVIYPRTIYGVRFTVHFARALYCAPATPPLVAHEFYLSPEELGRCLQKLDLATLQSRPI